MLSPSTESREPYPGLRSFQRHEVDIFFGRDDHVDEMIDKLARSHFLCVTGPSGCGKSSLARTGLMNGLEAGFLSGRGSDWIFVDFRPGGDPLGSLIDAFASALAAELSASAASSEQSTSADRKTEIDRLLTHHIALRSHSLIEAISIIDGIEDRPILILIDQFEELFRYAQKNAHSAAAFVDVLLRTIAAAGNIYVVITIRTDQLEKCSKYPGLTAAINDSQFLTPTLDRFEIQEALEGPIAVFGGRIHPDLTIWLLNSVEDEPDKLPLLQHVMKILYRHKITAIYEPSAQSSERSETVSSDKDSSLVIDLRDFLRLFTADDDMNPFEDDNRLIFRKSLTIRLNRIYQSFPPELRAGVETMFCALTETESGRRDIRRPQTIAELSAAIGLPTRQMRRIIEAFADEDETYLNTTKVENSPDDTIVDVSHECVLRLWDDLQNKWLPAEFANSENLRFLATCARNYRDGTEERSLFVRIRGDHILRGMTLDRYREWFDKKAPTAAWASRYLNLMYWPDRTASAEPAAEKSKLIFGWIETLLTVSGRRQRINKRVTTGLLVALIGLLGGFGVYSVIKAQTAQSTISLQTQLIAALQRGEATKGETAKQAGAYCGNASVFCDRIRSHANEPWNLKGFLTASGLPICPATRFRRTLNEIGDIKRTTCGSYSAVTDQTGVTPDIGSTLDDILVQAGIELGDSGQNEDARAVLLSFSKLYPNNPKIIRSLASTYQNDSKIAEGQRFSEAGACLLRAIDLSCLDASDLQTLDYNALALSDFLSESGLEKERLAVLTALAASFLTDQVFAQGEGDQSPLAIEALWRGAEAAVDAARILSKQFDCSIELLATSVSDSDGCKAATIWYDQGVKAWALMFKIARAKEQTLPESKMYQVNFGAGLAALYWSEDPIFRKFAKQSIDTNQIIAELEKAASLRRKKKPWRYWAGLAMMYCLEKDYARADKYTQILDLTATEQKFQEISQKAASCATTSNHENLFTNLKISK
jgi:energy-coupling factor transporter ATP-binding protein EcfA2